MPGTLSQLGILDWGIGGISIYKLIKGQTPVTYFSDTGVTPYGKMTRAEMVERLNAVISFLRSLGVTHIVIGCNAASTVIPQLRDQGVVIEGMIERAVDETIKLKPVRLGLIGGRRTVLSGVYRRAFRQRGISVTQRIAQPLSGLIESGDISSPRLRSECKGILSPLKNCSHILLACTHYPAIAPILEDLVSPETQLIDPAHAFSEIVSRWGLDAAGKDRFLTTGSTTAMKRSARLAFDVEIDPVVKVHI